MEPLEEILKVLLAISNALLYPVLILLILIAILIFFYIGKLLAEYSRRREGRCIFTIPSTHEKLLNDGKVTNGMIALFNNSSRVLMGNASVSKVGRGSWEISDGVSIYKMKKGRENIKVFIERSTEIEQNIQRLKKGEVIHDDLGSEFLARFYKDLSALIRHYKNEKYRNIISVKIERLLQRFDLESSKALEKPHLLVRLGPILGLMGTLIPLGPALLGLNKGNLDELSSNLSIAFSSTVVGLFIGAVSMIAYRIKRKWYKQDLNDMEYTAEMLMEMTENEQ